MAIKEVIEKRELHVVLGAHEAPASYRWKAVRFLTNDEDGSEAAAPQTVMIPATAEEVSAHLGRVVPKQLADIEADGERYAAQAKELACVRSELKAANAKLAAVAAALQ